MYNSSIHARVMYADCILYVYIIDVPYKHNIFSSCNSWGVFFSVVKFVFYERKNVII